MLEVLNLSYPIVIGMETYEGFMELDQTNSVVSMPESDSEMLGGHAITIVGYSLPHQQFLAKNSFGEDWGLMDTVGCRSTTLRNTYSNGGCLRFKLHY
jgi:hypothetical protein